MKSTICKLQFLAYRDEIPNVFICFYETNIYLLYYILSFHKGEYYDTR